MTSTSVCAHWHHLFACIADDVGYWVYNVLDNLVLTIVALWFVLVQDVLHVHFCVGCDRALYGLTTNMIHNVVSIFSGYLFIL